MKPYAYAVVQGENGRENVSLQFDHPEMCGQQYKQVIPLFTTPQTKPLSDLEQDACFNRGYKEGVRDALSKTKPLSDEEILEIADNLQESSQPYNINFARAIEKRHGIK